MTIILNTNQAELDALNRVFDDALFRTVLYRPAALWSIVLNVVGRGAVWTGVMSRDVLSAARGTEHPALTDFLRSVENGVAVNT